jgi:signal transduction histidine kinase
MVHAQFKEAADAKNIKFTYQSGDEMVFADSMRLAQILINLVGNALKFTTSGSIRVWTEKDGDNLGFFVEDTGRGIPEDQAELIFNEFYQVNASSTRDVGGTGLGLAVVKQFVSLQGGSVGVTSSFGKGSLFKFTLPLAETPLRSDSVCVAASVEKVC